MPLLEITFEGGKNREDLKAKALKILENDENIEVSKIFASKIRFKTDISRAQRAMSNLIKTGVAKSRLTLKTV